MTDGAPGRRPAPPGTVRAIRLVTAVTIRRWANRWWAGGWRGARPFGPLVADAPRRAVAGKGNARFTALIVVGAALFGFQVIVQTTLLASQAAPDDDSLVGGAAVHCLKWADSTGEFHTRLGRKGRDEHLRRCFQSDMRSRGLPVDEERAARQVERYDALGSGSFQEAPTFLSLWSPPTVWPAMGRAARAFVALTAILLAGICLTVLGSADARQLEQELEWLYQTPVEASRLLGAKAISMCLLQPPAWIVGGPMFFALARMNGHGISAYAFGAWAALQVGSVAGSVEMLVPLALGRVLGPATVRSVQGGLAVFGSLSIAGALIAARRFFPALEQAPAWLALSPGACLVPLLAFPGVHATSAALGAGWIVAPPIVAALVGGRLVRSGLVVSSGEASRRRAGRRLSGAPNAATAADPGSAGWRRGIVGKELRWVLRDRRAFTMTFLFPVLMLVPQALIGTDRITVLMSFATFNVRRAAGAGFALASYGFLFSAASSVFSEGSALWLLYTFPRTLQRTLLEKVALWCGVGLAYLTALCVAGAWHEVTLVEAPLHFTVAAAGVVIFAFIAAGLGALATDPFATQRRQMSPGIAYLYMGIAGTFAYVLFTESLYAKAIALAFFSLLALALWQKVRHRIPYLLDPTARPPPTLDVSDAILIVVAFFVFQLIVGLALLPLDLGPLQTLSLAFFGAGAVVVGGSLGILRRTGVPRLADAIGLGRTNGRWRVAAAVTTAPILGLALGAGARLYASRLAPRDLLEDGAAQAAPLDGAGWFVLTAVVSAPIFEELIFRGFMYRSLRREWPRWAAALTSAATFAACHPPLAVAPVFVVGLAAAGLVEWSASIAAPIVLHTTYNAVVLSGLWERVLRR